MEQKYNIKKFSFAELFSNSDGKTSGSGTAGLYIVLIGGICFLMGSIAIIYAKNAENILIQSIVFVSVGAALLGYRKSKNTNIIKKEESTSEESNHLLNS